MVQELSYETDIYQLAKNISRRVHKAHLKVYFKSISLNSNDEIWRFTSI
jgi:hypothetical protein